MFYKKSCPTTAGPRIWVQVSHSLAIEEIYRTLTYKLFREQTDKKTRKDITINQNGKQQKKAPARNTALKAHMLIFPTIQKWSNEKSEKVSEWTNC